MSLISYGTVLVLRSFEVAGLLISAVDWMAYLVRKYPTQALPSVSPPDRQKETTLRAIVIA